MPDKGILLDTHVWIWMVEGDRSRLGRKAAQTIERASRRAGVLVSAMSVWEVALLAARGRIRLAHRIEDWVAQALRAPGVRLVDLTPEIAMESGRLSATAPGDPVDWTLLASARALGARLATCDGRLLAFGAAGHVGVLDGRA
jgi:PIN domain nuclease of toxin-antitoxin system